MEIGAGTLSYLADLSLRALCLAAVAGAAIRLLRIRSAAGRHAIWTVTTVAMLLTAVAQPWLAPLPVRILPPTVEPAMASRAAVRSVLRVSFTERPARAARSALRRSHIPWREAAAATYGVGVLIFVALLASSYGFTRKLVRAGRKVDCLGVDDVFESSWISAPMTVGLLRPKILLPPGWIDWPADKFDAVMTHERAHVRRADWGVAVVAGLNRCLFWFHPLSWWLERHLAALAEQACDDATLLALDRRESYAQTLLDMAAAVRTRRGRMIWEAMAMARTAEVRKRIERILDDTREIPRAWTRARWMAAAVCSVPLVYVTVAARVAPAQAAGPAPVVQTGKVAVPSPAVSAAVAATVIAPSPAPAPQAAVTTAIPNPAPKPAGTDTPHDYLLSAEDVISILVYSQPQFEVKQQSVRPDGMITMPLVGEIKAAGKSPKELESEIVKVLGEKYLTTTPRVSVRVDQARNRALYFVTGGVNKPGQYPLLIPTTIMEALVNAGGFHEFANQKKINLIRDRQVILEFNFVDALKGMHPEKNVLLQPGDIIAVRD